MRKVGGGLPGRETPEPMGQTDILASRPLTGGSRRKQSTVHDNVDLYVIRCGTALEERART
jgi:hypothetical protein